MNVQRLYRQIVQADFRFNEGLVTSVYINFYRTTAKDFLSYGGARRTLERLWLGFMILLFGIVVLSVPMGLGSMFRDHQWWLAVAAVALWVFSLYNVLMAQGFLRWTYKASPRRRTDD